MKQMMLFILLLAPMPLMAEKDVCIIEYPKSCDISFTYKNANEAVLTYTCKNKDDMYMLTEGLKQKFFSQLFTFGRPKLFFVKTIFRKTDKDINDILIKCE